MTKVDNEPENGPEINGEDFTQTESYVDARAASRENFKIKYGSGAGYAVSEGFEDGARWGLAQTPDPKPEEMWKPEYEPNEYDEAFPVPTGYADRRMSEMDRFISSNPSPLASVHVMDLEIIWNWAYDIAYQKGYKHGRST